MDLAPIETIAARDIELTAATTHFASGLASRQDLTRRSSSLTHRRAADLPAGALHASAVAEGDQVGHGGPPVGASHALVVDRTSIPVVPVVRPIESSPQSSRTDDNSNSSSSRNGNGNGGSSRSPATPMGPAAGSAVEQLLALPTVDGKLPARPAKPVAPPAAGPGGGDLASLESPPPGIGEPRHRSSDAQAPADHLNAPAQDVTRSGEPIGGGDRQLAAGGRPSLADSRRRGLGPAYHGPLPEAMRAEALRARSETIADTAVHREHATGRAPSAQTDGVAPDTRSEPVASDLRSTVHHLLGVDVGDRLVHRGDSASAEARAMGAQAFVRDGEVFVSDDVGSLETSAGRSVVAHELTHVAQQRGGPVPPNDSAAGQAMEAEAQLVEQHVRGDAGAVDADLIESTHQMMREMVDRGVARPDGSGGIVFTMPPSSMSPGAGVQRLTSAAPQAPSRDSAAHRGNWSGGETFVHDIGHRLANDTVSIAGSAFGFSDEFTGEQRRELDNDDRQFQQRQTRTAFAEMRMEHLRSTRLAEIQHDDAGQRPRTDQLSDTQLAEIRRQVDREVAERVAQLEQLKTQALDEINRARTDRNERREEQLDADSEDRAFHLMFDDPVQPVPPNDRLLEELRGGEHDSGRESGSRRQQTGPGASGREQGDRRAPGGGATVAGAAAGGAVAGAMAHRAEQSPGSGPSADARATSSSSRRDGATSSAAAADRQAARTSWTAAGDGAVARHSASTTTTPRLGARSGGTSSDRAGRTGSSGGTRGSDGEPQWTARRDQTVGQNFSSMGRTLLADAAHAQMDSFGSAFGLSDDTVDESKESIDRDLRLTPASDADGQGAATRAAGTAATTASDHTAGRTAETASSRPVAGALVTTGVGTVASGHDASPAGASTSTAQRDAPPSTGTSAVRSPSTPHDTVEHLVSDQYALDELALRLYPSIRSRLRQELLVDRERAGLLIDLR